MSTEQRQRGESLSRIGQADTPGTYPKRVLVRTKGTILVVNTDLIRWIGAEGAHISLHTTDGIQQVRVSIGRFEQVLPPSQFARIHRSAIVNLGTISRMQALPSGKCAVVLDDNTRLIVSRSCRDLLLRRYVSVAEPENVRDRASPPKTPVTVS